MCLGYTGSYVAQTAAAMGDDKKDERVKRKKRKAQETQNRLT